MVDVSGTNPSAEIVEVVDVVDDDDVGVSDAVGSVKTSKEGISTGPPMRTTSPSVCGGTDDDDDDDDDELAIVDELVAVVSSVEEMVESVTPPSIVTMGDAGVSSN